jgi:hypothetical protein
MRVERGIIESKAKKKVAGRCRSCSEEKPTNAY